MHSVWVDIKSLLLFLLNQQLTNSRLSLRTLYIIMIDPNEIWQNNRWQKLAWVLDNIYTFDRSFKIEVRHKYTAYFNITWLYSPLSGISLILFKVMTIVVMWYCQSLPTLKMYAFQTLWRIEWHCSSSIRRTRASTCSTRFPEFLSDLVHFVCPSHACQVLWGAFICFLPTAAFNTANVDWLGAVIWSTIGFIALFVCARSVSRVWDNNAATLDKWIILIWSCSWWCFFEGVGSG